ncbi:CHAT domain-containing protein [Mycena rebaudengoi]|nr:CHAT domain-containing protein [Mycena rebaudengoi]
MSVQSSPVGDSSEHGESSNPEAGDSANEIQTHGKYDPAIQEMKQLIQRTPAGHPDLPGYHLDLGELFGQQYDESGDIQNLKVALGHKQAALDLMDEEHPERIQCLESLAKSYWDRHERLGDPDDLEVALHNHLQAELGHIPDDHPDRFEHLNNLAVSHTFRYRRLGKLQDLEAALQYQHMTVELTPEDHANRPWILLNLVALYTDRIKGLDDLKDLEAALQYNLEAINLTPEDHPLRDQHLQNLHNLAGLYINQYQKLGDLNNLEAALQHYQTAVSLTPEDHPNRAEHLWSLAVSYSRRYKKLGDLVDLKMALQYKQESVNFTPKGHPDRGQHLHSLANSYFHRYQRLGDLQDLEAALQYGQATVDLTPEDHPDRARHLQSLGAFYSGQYKRLGDLQDLEAALQYCQAAVDLTPEDHPDRAQHLHGLGSSYSDRYKRLGYLEDFKAALQYNQAVVDITPKDDPGRAHYLQNLAIVYVTHYQRLGDLQDLEAASQYFQAAVDLTPEDHPDRAWHLQNLGACYSDRYQRLGDLKDLALMLQYGQAAVSLTPEDHADRAHRLQNLAGAYSDRYKRLGDLEDLKTAFQYKKSALNLTPKGHPDRVPRLQNLALSCSYRYQRLHDLQDLEAELKYNQAAIDLTPEDHPNRAQGLQSLAISYMSRYHRLGELEDLRTALQYNQAAVDLTPEDHPHRALHLASLANSYMDCYQKLGDLKDLEIAIQYQKTAMNLIPGDHPNRAQHLYSLALSYIYRYQKFKEPDDLKHIHTYFKTSLNLITSTPEKSWDIALHWASFAAQNQPEYCITAYQSAFCLLPEILWIGHSVPVRLEAVQRLEISKATSSATWICIILSDLTSAVEIMEQGLGTIYQQILQFKTAIDQLPPEQALAFQHLSRELYTQGSDSSMTLVNQRNDLIKEIRKQPGSEFFLLPKPYEVLCQASQGGPIIILNSNQGRCDGIIVLNPTSQPVHIPFPNVTLDLLVSQRTTLAKLHRHRARGDSASTRLFGHEEGWMPTEQQYENMLTWLWTYVVSPVYQVLELHGIQNGRLWWLPTGAFTGLPLHACAPTDQFIHSYTATLSSLLEAYSRKISNTNVAKVGVVGVTHTGPELQSFLPAVEQEVKNICSAVPGPYVECLMDEQATVDATKKLMQDCTWIHLACHGKQDLDEPIKSHLQLYGGRLQLEDILKMPLENAEIVFLAACQTAMGDSKLVNESFHLGGGLIAAGFRGAIGTLWPMVDQDGPHVAKLFYSHIFGHGHQPQASDAAEALHFAIKELKKDVSYERWIPFIHIGV